MDTRHLVASVYLFARFGATWRMGVTAHSRLSGETVPRAHVEPGESSAQAAVRKCLEETGYRVRLLPPTGHPLPADYPHAQGGQAAESAGTAPWWVVSRPAAADNRPADQHLHVDHIHVAVVDRPYGPRTPGEHLFRWVTVDELVELDAPADTGILGSALFDVVPATAATQRPRPQRDEELRCELLRRRDIDQEFRDNLPAQLTEEISARWKEVDEDNTEWLRQVITRVGWPGRALCGDEGAEAAWLLAQHADRQPRLQGAWADLLAEAVTAGDAEPWHLAFLEDRIAIHGGTEGGLQWFGTQFQKTPGSQWKPFPICDPEGVGQCRAEVGLDTLAERAKRIAEEND
ncbi:DUF6624 domain-containing protein [Streptomyces syringium]|uniref:DUF6624 domain-containing protein n=1 Tax=Streptomyces syringium TaxID=76729 RepID=UPI003D8ED2EE